MAGMLAQKFFVSLANGFEPLLDSSAERGAGQTGSLLAEGGVLSDPLVHFRLGRVIQFQELPVFLLDRVVRIRYLDGNAARTRDEIADGNRLIGGDQRAEQTDQKIIHARNLSKPSIRSKHGKTCGLHP